MDFIEILVYIFIVIGTCLNISLGLIQELDFQFIMKKNIFLTLTIFIIGFVFSKLPIIDSLGLNNGDNDIDIKENNDSSFRYEIPSMTDEEFKELSKEEDFQEVNPANLYIKTKLKEDLD